MAPRSSAASTEAPPRICPNCGDAAFVAAPIVLAKTDAKDREQQQEAIDSVVKARGERLRCTGCGYVTHATDDLTPQAK